MPRQIIDTESSRPAYNRRRLIRAAVVVGILIVVLILALLVFRHHLVALVGPGNGLWEGGTTLVTLSRSLNAA